VKSIPIFIFLLRFKFGLDLEHRNFWLKLQYRIFQLKKPNPSKEEKDPKCSLGGGLGSIKREGEPASRWLMSVGRAPVRGERKSLAITAPGGHRIEACPGL